MKLDVTQAIKSVQGKPLMTAVDEHSPPTELTLRTALIESLMATAEKCSGPESLRRFTLASKIQENDTVDLATDDAAFIQSCAETRYGQVPAVLGPVWKILNEG